MVGSSGSHHDGRRQRFVSNNDSLCTQSPSSSNVVAQLHSSSSYPQPMQSSKLPIEVCERVIDLIPISNLLPMLRDRWWFMPIFFRDEIYTLCLCAGVQILDPEIPVSSLPSSSSSDLLPSSRIPLCGDQLPSKSAECETSRIIAHSSSVFCTFRLIPYTIVSV